jgi:signal transduction histidine kinase
MFPRSARNDSWLAGVRLWALWASLPLSLAFPAQVCRAQGDLPSAGNDSPRTGPYRFLTNTAQFKALSEKDYLNECRFRLTGVVTLVDTNRDLLVLQDASGAVALNFNVRDRSLQVGQFVSVAGTNCFPYVVNFPDYPFHPSVRDVRSSFEAPPGAGDYYLTRMRGYLHPTKSGEYTFWIASDNSSELWLSTNEDPTRSRRIAFISRYNWVSPHEWSRFFSQRSESIFLEAGHSYYIEALQEQTTQADHLSVAWRGPEMNRAVISGQYLTPWMASHGSTTETKGILREYWTNYSAGNLAPLTTPRAFESALTVDKVQLTVLGEGKLPDPMYVTVNQNLLPEENFRWVWLQGQVKFAGVDGNVAFLELSGGPAQIQVRASHWTPELASGARDRLVRIEGVCEGMYDRNGTLVRGLIWASAKNSISLVGSERTTLSPIAMDPPASSTTASTNSALSGFYGTRGIVTFNDRVFDKDYLWIQEDAAPVFVSLKDRRYKNQLKVGQWIDLGGPLQPGKYVPTISPLVMTELGWRPMPVPMSQPIQLPVSENWEGRWTEVEGIVHSVNSNGTICLLGMAGPICLWIGKTPSNYLGCYVDARIRARGVLTLTVLDAPLLLVPSRIHLDVEEEAPKDPFELPPTSIADLVSRSLEESSLHRVRLSGEVTYQEGRSFLMQDDSGGVRVQTLSDSKVKPGEAVEVVGFPAMNGGIPTLTEALVRYRNVTQRSGTKELDLNEAVSVRQIGTLIHVSANVLSQKTAGAFQVLELQEQQRVFEATLANELGHLPTIAPGSRLALVGVCDYETIAPPAAGRTGIEKSSAGPLNIRLRSPVDVSVLSGPPWWTWKRTAALVGTLFTVLTASFLWIHLLRGRLLRQRAAQTAFSQQILQNLESERRRIAGNLHDGLGQNLLVIKNQALLALQNDADESLLRQRLDEISGVASQAIEEVRQITHGLRPYQLDRLGLTQAIRATVSRTSANSPILFATRTDDIDGVFDQESEIHVYRIVQEAVNNVVKHSDATEAVVVIKKREASVTLSIRDNGRGFDVQSAQPSEFGYGLSGITERIRILGGTLMIDSCPGGGTHLTVEVPVLRKRNARSDNINRR